ncbi:MAG: para-aminobenzoate synthetase component 1 [Polaribacter sp.]|jgi:para-aminobenzoate synthetase component 1
MNNKTASIRRKATFNLRDLPDFHTKALVWAATFPLCTALDSNHYEKDSHHRYDQLIAVGEEVSLQAKRGEDSFEQLKKWHKKEEDWLFGYLSYDLKNEVEKLVSNNKNVLQWPDMLFFQPSVVLAFEEAELTVHSIHLKPELVVSQICNQIVNENEKQIPKPVIKSGMTKEYYLKSVEAVRQHIIAGDLYEMNLCQEFFAENYEVDPLLLFQELNAIAKAPFATFFRWEDAYLCCASPERFIQKRKDLIISQPIKGTIARGETEKEDVQFQQDLYASIKDRAENVMIVDLVRNDFARSCQSGSVKVNELFAIYPFEQVSHMISTVSGLLRKDIHFSEALKNAFPMGSMTGAPKVMSMELIENYEKCRRGLYSGTVGYITPEGDFDFNVVIRSILYDAAKKYLSFQVGGAIVYDSVPEKEYEECLLKAKGMLKVLGVEI